MLRTSPKLELEINHLNLKAVFQNRHRRMSGLSIELASARSSSKIVLKCLCFDET